MIDHVTDGVVAARTRARVNALVIDAGAIGWAVCVQRAFRATFNVRVAVVVGHAGACAGIAALLANGIHAARSRVTWVAGFVFFFVPFRRADSPNIKQIQIRLQNRETQRRRRISEGAKVPYEESAESIRYMDRL